MSIFRFSAFACLALAATAAMAEQRLWSLSDTPIYKVQDIATANRWFTNYRVFDLDFAGMRQTLADAPREDLTAAKAPGMTLRLPMPDGTLQKFWIAKSPIFTPELAKKMPGVMTYVGNGIDDPSARARLDIGPNGFHGMILSTAGDMIIDPVARQNTGQYVVFYRRDSYSPKNWNCYTDQLPKRTFSLRAPLAPGQPISLKTYRLAMHTTGEYTAKFGSESAAMAQVVTTVNRVAGVYENDLAIRMTLVHNHCYTDAGSDPFSGDDVFAMLSENQTKCDEDVGDENYDIGHAMSTGFGGVAFLGVVGTTGQKAHGATGLDEPFGDGFDIDFVAHEMGHQWGGNHTFNGTTLNCGGGTRVAEAAYEVGSGSTIQAYAGICGSEDVQPHSDAYFHAKSLQEIGDLRDSAQSGGTSTATSNQPPIATGGTVGTIPRQTPFRLLGNATDGNNDPLTYCWEQYDLGDAEPTHNTATRPLFRSRPAVPVKYRVFPPLSKLLLNQSDPWELLPLVDRTLNFRLTVRDNKAGGGAIGQANVTFGVEGAPFTVTAPNTYETWNGGTTHTITWNPGGTAGYSPNVNIRLSYNGGGDYGFNNTVMLKANTPNDGSEAVTIPVTGSGEFSRIFVESANSIFFNVAPSAVKIIGSTDPLLIELTPATVVGGLSSTGKVTIPNPAPAGGIQVGLADNGAELSTPASVTIAQGATTATFGITTAAVNASVTRTVTATQGANQKTANLVINRGGLSNLTVNPTTVTGGNNTTGTISLTGQAVAGSNTINLTDNSTVLTTPANMTVNVGATSGTFTIGTTNPSAAATRQVTATFGSISRSASVTVNPGAQLVSLGVSPATVTGGSNTTGTVTLSQAAPTGGMNVTLSDNSSVLVTPAGTLVAAGTTTKTFTVGTTNVSATVTRTVSAQLGSVLKSANVTVNPGLDLQSFTVSPPTVPMGSNTTGTVTLTLNAPAGGTTVTIQDNSSVLVTPASVLVAAGTKTKTFTIGTTNVSATVTRQVYAKLGAVTKTVNVTVQLVHALANFVINPNSVKGGTATTGVVTMTSAAPAGGSTVTITDNTSVITPPPSVVVLAGATSANFTINTSVVSTSATRQVTVTFNGVSKTANLTVNP